MRIGFDVSQTGSGKAGCGYFADSLIRTLARIDDENEYVLYPAFGNGFWDPEHDRTTFATRQSNFRRGPEGMTHGECMAFWTRPPEDLERRLGDPDVVHANNYFAPRGLRHARLVYTLYDLIPLDRPEFLTEANRLVCFDGLFEASLWADALIAISRHTRERFLRFFPHYPPDRVHVVYPASRFRPEDPEPRPEDAPDGLRPGEFWLSVGTREPRKNLRRVLRAYASLVSRGETDRPLALAGGSGWLEEGLPPLVAELGLGGRVRLLGYVPDETLRWLYRNCFAFVYPSLAEGFGLPPLEAMSLGAAVVTSNTTSLPEVVGDAAITVDPEDDEALAEAMRRLSGDAALRDGLRQRGLEQASRFSWEGAARDVLRVYEDVRGRPAVTPAAASAAP